MTQTFGAEVLLLLHIVVVAVHRHLPELEPRKDLAHRLKRPLHHRLAVLARIVLRPADRFDVVVEDRLAFDEESEVLVRHVIAEHALLEHPAGGLDEVLPDLVARSARARVQHHPHMVAFIEADLDEVVA